VELEVGLDGRPLDAEISLEEYVFAPRAGESFEPREIAPPAMPPERPEETEPGARTLEELEAALCTAGNRDALASALLDFCADRAERAGLFAVGKDGIRGIAGRGRAFSSDEVRRVLVGPGSGTVFDTALKSRDFYFGVVPALPPNRDLYVALGGRLPATVFLLPILVRERTAALLYLDGDDRPIANPDIALMRRVAGKAGLAFEMLLLKNKLREI
jgi:hypothetical protein